MKKVLISIVVITVFLLSGCRSSLNGTDREAPEITINEHQSEFYLGGVVPIISATCKDNVDETCLVTTPNYPDLSVHGLHTVTFRAEDSSGNISYETVVINAIDRAEYITLSIGLYNTTVELGETYIFPIVTCSSSESSTCTVEVPVVLQTDELNPELTYTISGSDDQENTRYYTITVEVVDTTAPTVSLNGEDVINVELGDTWTDPGITSSDFQEGLVESQDITPDLNVPGEYIITYSVEDPSGNIGTATRTVNVVDTTDPIITLTGDAAITIELGAPWTDPGVTTSDLQEVTVTQNVTVDVNVVGVYEVNYTAEDASGNTSFTTRTVTVSDTTNPIITLIGDAIINITSIEGETWIDPGVTASDLQDVTVTQNITPDYKIPGTYEIIYTAEDASGNTSTVTRTVNVS